MENNSEAYIYTRYLATRDNESAVVLQNFVDPCVQRKRKSELKLQE